MSHWRTEEKIPWDQQNFAGSGIKILNTFGIRDQKLGWKYGISDENIYLVTTLRLDTRDTVRAAPQTSCTEEWNYKRKHFYFGIFEIEWQLTRK